MSTFPSIPPIPSMASGNPNGFSAATTADGDQTAAAQDIFNNAPQGEDVASLLDITNEAIPWKIVTSEERLHAEVHVETYLHTYNSRKRSFAQLADVDDDEETLGYALRTIPRQEDNEVRRSTVFTKSTAVILAQVKSPSPLKTPLMLNDSLAEGTA
jgi:hypothetical protein